MRTANVAIALAALGLGCGGEGSPGLSQAAQRGQRVYQNVCIACHHGDPNQDGALGPAIAGSSRELVYARVIEGGYPPGYTPKRPGQVMPKFPNLENDIDDLVAYLDETKSD